MWCLCHVMCRSCGTGGHYSTVYTHTHSSWVWVSAGFPKGTGKGMLTMDRSTGIQLMYMLKLGDKQSSLGLRSFRSFGSNMYLASTCVLRPCLQESGVRNTRDSEWTGAVYQSSSESRRSKEIIFNYKLKSSLEASTECILQDRR